MLSDPNEPLLIFRREYWIKPGILEIEIRLNIWALPLFIVIDDMYQSVHFLCLSISLGRWNKDLSKEEREKLYAG